MHLNLPNVDLTAGHGSFSCHIVAVYTSSLDPQMEAGNMNGEPKVLPNHTDSA